MHKKRKGKRIAFLGGAIVLVVIGLIVVFYRGEVRAWYLSWHWRQIAVVVLDNCDPNYKGQGPHGDAIRFLRQDGTKKFVLAGLNNCESIGCSHGVVFDPDRFRIYFCENVRKSVTALEPTGKVVFRTEDTNVSAMAVDPETGNLWCLTGGSIGTGQVIVLDLNGEHAATHSIPGFDTGFSLTIPR